MASNQPFVEVPEDELTCIICQELFTDPTVLPCGHTFCRGCLQGYYMKSQAPITQSIRCPACRNSALLGTDGICGLPGNSTLLRILEKRRMEIGIPCSVCDKDKSRVALKSCLKCELSFCMECLSIHHPSKGGYLTHQLAEPRLNLKSPTYSDCNEHGARLTQFCNLCKVPVCSYCDIDGDHEQHELLPLESAYKHEQARLQNEFATLLTLIKHLEEEVSVADSSERSVDKQSDEQYLDVSGTGFNENLHVAGNPEESLAVAEGCHRFTKEGLKETDHLTFLSMVVPLENRLKEVIQSATRAPQRNPLKKGRNGDTSSGTADVMMPSGYDQSEAGDSSSTVCEKPTTLCEKPKQCVTHACKSDGGIFSFRGSESSLLIPVGAVGDGETVQIVQRTVRNVHSYRETFHLEEHQVFVSPVIELSCQNNFTGFNKHVTIYLPICRDLQQEDIQVYGFHGGEVENIPREVSNSDEGCFYLIEGRTIGIHTWHFSKYYACTCNPKITDLQLTAFVYARTERGQSCSLRLFLCDQLHSMPDFKNNLDEQEEEDGFIRIHHGRVHLLEEIKSEDIISAAFHSDKWRPQVSPVTNQPMDHIMEVGVQDVISCNRRDTTEVGTWDLIRDDSPDSSRSTLLIVHTGKRQSDENGERKTNIGLQNRLQAPHLEERRSGGMAQKDSSSRRDPLHSMIAHSELLALIEREIPKNSPSFEQLKRKAIPYTSLGQVEGCRSTYDILRILESAGHIPVGDYSTLKRIFENTDRIDLQTEIERRERNIQFDLRKEGEGRYS